MKLPATPELPRMIITAKTSNVRIIGMSQYSLRRQRKLNSSPRIPIRMKKSLIPLLFFGLLSAIFDYSNLVTVYSSDYLNGLRTRFEPRTNRSMSLLLKVLKASPGVFTIGSPRRLNDVLSTTGTPVASPNVFTMS